MKNHLGTAVLLGLGMLLASCGEQPSKPYLKIVGGGFIFNYRYATMNYGFVAKQLKPLPEGSILEASFDLPDSETNYLVKKPATPGKFQYSFESEPLHGVKKNTPYKVTLRLIEAATGKELAMLEKSFTSDVDQEGLPTKAPVTGIGYQLAPE